MSDQSCRLYRGPRRGKDGWWITIDGREYFAPADLELDEAVDDARAQAGLPPLPPVDEEVRS